MNYEKIRPPARAKIIKPPTKDWPLQGILPLGDLPSAAGTVIDRGLLPQLLRQGLGRMGSVHMVDHFAQKFPRLKELREKTELYGQGVVTRLENVRERVKSKVRGQTVLPTPWGPRFWPRGEDVGGLPSVSSIWSGPAASMLPMLGRMSSTVKDGRDISIHTDMDNPPEADLKTGISVQVE